MIAYFNSSALSKRLRCEGNVPLEPFQSESVTDDSKVQETIDALLALAQIVDDGC